MTTMTPPSNNWLSEHNAVATVDQRELENQALALLVTPELQRARAIAATLWRSVMAYPAREQMSRFEQMLDEYVFYHALRAVNSDPAHPKVLWLMTPPGHWFGRDIPGSRWGGDSADFIYRMIPIGEHFGYEIHGELASTPASSISFSLMTQGAAPATLAVLDSLDLKVDAQGRFVITIDGGTAGGRSNHLQSAAGVDHLLIRDALGDWCAEAPAKLSVSLTHIPQQRTGDRQQLADTEAARRAARDIVDAFYFTYFCTQSGCGQPPNTLRAPTSSAAFGGMPTQWGTKGNLLLEPDEAMMVTTNVAGAAFRNFSLSDQFFRSNEYWLRTSSLNMTQMVADEDGRYTVVIAHRDPGAYNWLDTGGLRHTILGHRWQMIARDYSGEPPALTARVVKWHALEKALPAGICSITASERQHQLASRREGYARRWLDS